MAKNTGRGSRQGAVKSRTQTSSKSGVWVKRDSSSGKLLATKQNGGKFKGVRTER